MTDAARRTRRWTRALTLRLPVVALLVLAGCQPGADRVEEEQRQRVLAVLQERANAPLIGQTVLLGSSTLARWPAGLGVTHSVNLAVSGDTVPALVQRLRGYPGLAQAERLVLNIGLNDLRKHCAAEAVDLTVLMRALPAGVPMLWFGIQGVSPSVREGWCKGRFAELSRSLNGRVEEACSKRPACRFVRHPIGEEIDAQASRLWHVADGIHLSAAGYRSLAAALFGSPAAGTAQVHP